MKGVDIRTVQEVLGHPDIRITLRYSHVSPAHLLDTIEKLAEERTGTATGTSETSAKTGEAEAPAERRTRERKPRLPAGVESAIY
jgi:hypothetical protein